MPVGVRHTDWAQIHLHGDREVAASYIPTARKVLGEALASAEPAQLGVTYVQKELPDGAVVVAEKIGDIPRVTIYPPARPAEQPPATTPDDFVVWARDDGMPTGIDDEHPQQILRSPAEESDAWRVFTYDSDTAGRRTGTYIGTFPDGVRHAGNVDWRGQGGARLSWYGPSTRYWVDPFVQPRTQYGGQVFHLGQVLLDMQEYADASEEALPAARWVMGAAMRGAVLYVMQAELPVMTTTTDSQPANTIMTDSYTTRADLPHALCRYTLARDPEGQLLVIAGSRQVIWSGVLRTGAMPFFFSPDARRLHCFGISPGGFGGMDFTVFNTLDPASDKPPATTSPVFKLVIEEGDAGETATPQHSTVSVAPNGRGCIAADYTDSGDLVEVCIRRQTIALDPYMVGGNNTTDHFFIEVAGASIDLMEITTAGTAAADPVAAWFQRRYVMHADARAGLLVVARERMGIKYGDMVQHQVNLDIHLRGGLLHTRTVVQDAGNDAQTITGLLRDYYVNDAARSAWRELPVNPMFALYNFCTAVVGVASYIGYEGAHAGFFVLPYQAPEYFGARKAGGAAGVPAPIADWCSAAAARARQDFDGKDIVLGAAARGNVVLLSAYTFTNEQLDSLHFVSGTELPTLTGVGGANARFHPIWMLGKPAEAA